MKKLILLAAFLLPSSLYAQGDVFNHLVLSQEITIPVCKAAQQPLNDYNIPHSTQASYVGPEFYSPYLNHCRNWISSMEYALEDAQLAWNNGDAVYANNLLYNTLSDLNSTIGSEIAYPLPHTYRSIKAGFKVADSLRVAFGGFKLPKSKEQDLDKIQKNMVISNTLKSIYALIFWTYDNLDDPYYDSLVNECFSTGFGCKNEYRRGNSRLKYLTQTYFDKLDELAVLFLNLQLQNGPAQGSNYAEIELALGTTKAAKMTLLSSNYRRSFSCSINKLFHLEQIIDRYKSNCTGLSDRQKIVSVRRKMNRIRNEISNTCKRPIYRCVDCYGNRGRYSNGYSY